MKLLKPSAGRILDAEKAGRLAVGGIHARAAARALAVLHISNSGGVVCAAPTGGSCRSHSRRHRDARRGARH